ncbi:extracellular solute-binding protein [Pseudoalteromonas sp. OOF1S-7]|uniref:sugar ABC transporter substrate-binding protein n=1 Tax=Pseudoalteromonas sp. OOF1S-7 TaxID=2917757 RepID=UPI001EF6F601|nr:extracellular solute-binding protein [Pseudoalteromonas sp. OOF1S-7]MCG7534803.1 extracellular solute-binding protein [Pseudoalteromonas sp. OOF1S-7]
MPGRLCTILLFILLTGLCSRLGYAKQLPGQTLTIAIGLENYDFKPLFAQFTRKTGIQVKVVEFENNSLKSELLLRASNNALPDGIIVPADYMGLTALNLSEVPDDWLSTHLIDQVRMNIKANGSTLGIPIVFGNHLMLYYNRALVSDAAKNWQQLRIQHQEDGLKISWNYYEMYWYRAFLGTFGTSLILNGNANLDTSAMVSALRWYKSLKDEAWLDVECDYDCTVNQFLSGEVAYTINGSWMFQRFSEHFGDKLGVTQLPSLRGEPMRSYFSSHVMAFPDHALSGEKSTQLRTLSEFLQSLPVQTSLWSSINALPVDRRALEMLKIQGITQVEALISTLEYAQPMPNEAQMAFVWEAMLKGLTRHLAGVLDEHQAAHFMQHIVEKSISYEQEKKPGQ